MTILDDLKATNAKITSDPLACFFEKLGYRVSWEGLRQMASRCDGSEMAEHALTHVRNELARVSR